MNKNHRMNPLDHTPPSSSQIIVIQPVPKGTHVHDSCNVFYKDTPRGVLIPQDAQGILDEYARYVGEERGLTGGWYTTSDYGCQLTNGQVFVRLQLSDFTPLYGFVSIFDIVRFFYLFQSGILYVGMNHGGAPIPLACSIDKTFQVVGRAMNFYDPEEKRHSGYPGAPIEYWLPWKESLPFGRVPEQPVVDEIIYRYVDWTLKKAKPSNVWNILKGDQKQLAPKIRQFEESRRIIEAGQNAGQGALLPPASLPGVVPATQPGLVMDAQYWKKKYEQEHSRNKMLLDMLHEKANGETG